MVTLNSGGSRSRKERVPPRSQKARDIEREIANIQREIFRQRALNDRKVVAARRKAESKVPKNVFASDRKEERARMRDVKELAHGTVNRQPRMVSLGQAHPAASEFAEASVRVLPSMAAKVPFNVLGVPTPVSLTASTYYTMNIAVTAAQYRMGGLWPGHGRTDWGAPLDLVSAHAFQQNIGGTPYVIGPVQTAARTPSIGFVGLSQASSSYPSVTSTAGYLPVQPLISLPFTASDGQGHHTRWRLTGMRIRWTNLNTLSTQGGEITTVCPDHDDLTFHGNPIGVGARYSTYRLHLGEFQFEDVYPLLPEDVYWWHSESGTDYTTPQSLGYLFTIMAPSGSDQTWKMEVFCNWEMSGSNLVQLCTPVINSPAARDQVVPAMMTNRIHGDPKAFGKIVTAHALVDHPDAGARLPAVARRILNMIPSASMTGLGEALGIPKELMHAGLAVGKTIGKKLLGN